MRIDLEGAIQGDEDFGMEILGVFTIESKVVFLLYLNAIPVYNIA
jgi:hypothetical protein